MSALFEVRQISKSFPGVKVLDDINIRFEAGKVHAIVGENGAGKSTFMNIVFGVYQDYEGEMLWEGRPVRFDSPTAAQKQGIAMVHQENSLVPNLSVMDNIYMGRFPRNGPFIDRKALRKKVVDLLEELKITNIAPETRVEFLSVAQKQLIEIIKALSLNARLLMLDEPTAALTAKETEYLMDILNDLRKKGVAIVYVSHRLEEVFSLCDEISVLRDGRMIRHLDRAEFDYNTVVSSMVGRDLDTDATRRTDRDLSNAPVTIEVKDLCCKNLFRNVSFTARRGEVLGFGGLVGAGRSELMEAIFGYIPATSGEIFINQKRRSIKHPADAVKAGIGMVPEERKVKGIFPDLSVMDNINVVSYDGLRKGGLISRKSTVDTAKQYVGKLSIRTTDVFKLVGQLSGGNQQKCILSRWLRMNPQILILDEPTHGIDIGAKNDIYEIIRELADQGITVLLISSEMPELIRLSDRVVVMCEGNQTAILEKDQITEDTILHYAMRRNAN